LLNISEEHIASIFRTKEQAKQEISLPPAPAGFLFDLLFSAEDGGGTFLQNTLLSPSH
jgi:hypothetical protein